MNWDHVDHEISRRLLAGEEVDAFDMTEAIEFANQCLREDALNEDVSNEVYGARCEAFVSADFYWGEGDTGRVVENLRRFWGV